MVRMARAALAEGPSKSTEVRLPRGIVPTAECLRDRYLRGLKLRALVSDPRAIERCHSSVNALHRWKEKALLQRR
jgi:hypothetical protein